MYYNTYIINWKRKRKYCITNVGYYDKFCANCKKNLKLIIIRLKITSKIFSH